MSVSINEVKPGLTVVLDGQLFRCLEYHHQRAAQQSWIKIKFKNMRTGAIIEKTFKPGEKVEDAIKYLREGFVATIAFYDDEVLDVNLPTAVELKVTETSPGFKGDTVSGGKPATMETGLVVQVPFFVNEGDLLKVDTRDGKYCGRV